MIPLKNMRKNHMTFCHICKREFNEDDTNYQKLVATVITQVNIEVQHNILQPKIQKTKGNSNGMI